MSLSIFDLFKVGIGPSSSHTVGPMVAANRFLAELQQRDQLMQVEQVKVGLYGSLAMTGKGHSTDIAVMVGLLGETPDEVDPDSVPVLVEQIKQTEQLNLAGQRLISFCPETQLLFNFAQSLPKHPNGMRFQAFDAAGIVLHDAIFYSVGGGFVLSDAEADVSAVAADDVVLPYDFNNGVELLELCKSSGLSVAQIMMANESVWRSEEEVKKGLRDIWQVMDSCIKRGCVQKGVLPGGLGIKRRANELYEELRSSPEASFKDQLTVMDWINLFAIAVNEENAAGGRVVTAPTNGAAGVIPAVLAYYDRFVHGSSEQGIFDFLATAAAIGMLYKKNASISAAEVGCQGEIGVACSMAAGALCAVMGGTIEQVENAAEIGMEHNLGLTCDPIEGLVQVPCIERNTMGAVKAINAARLAMRGDGQHHVSLDSVIETMRQTGVDMQDKYKETSQGGLAVNVVAC
ncbi:L-serine ammonia-lyase [Amphritea sp. 2_MG-2023]|uniref:L-serine ammonia-lyase n=1 Tax=Amphritea TaxID=515417 RepID=UPI001C06CD40|nr:MULTISPECIES: L-serine ammonia-lyase [Amphritea]MBU2965918.1 L-serine ammonia-lyase [Amphritea atlantica]MDO6418008.1 L-serine ammonia-lyase [Amphritea sp. 2_MG-2023]